MLEAVAAVVVQAAFAGSHALEFGCSGSRCLTSEVRAVVELSLGAAAQRDCRGVARNFAAIQLAEVAAKAVAVVAWGTVGTPVDCEIRVSAAAVPAVAA
mmetsp:Transcript_59380/g.109824  ORF Transcript_59380/g.109824 Transcript_59380/m.109824 type:complete len:99 (-) Transcript_59380:47-343(-)